MFKFGTNSIERMKGVNPRLIEVAEGALALTPIDFGIPKLGGLRTAEEQYNLFQQGASQLDGYEKKSYHQSGNALDVFAYVNGRASWDENYLSLIAAAMLESANRLNINLAWGGHWKSFRDMPHFEIPS